MHYRFANCDFDTEHPTVLQRAGRRVTLQRLVSRVLTYLLEHHGRLVSKDELAAQVWHGAIDNTTIEGCIRKVRQAIGDTGRNQRVIKTHVGYGYEFIASFETPSPEPPDDPAPSVPSPSIPNPVPGPLPEAKVVTILCCGVDPTAASRVRAELDILHSQLRVLYRLIRQEAAQYGGTIQPITDNRLLVVFGAPLAQEDHAQRAVLAALGLHQQLNTLGNTRQTSPPESLVVRMGLHTGEVALGGFEEDQTMATAMVGDTVRLAMALQEVAEPGTILSSAVTIRLVEGLVHIEPVQPMPLAGQSTPLRVYKVLQRVSPPASGPSRPRPVRQFVGRRPELATLRQRLEQVADGHGHVIGITGEPGMGKSRLLTEFCQRLHQHSVPCLTGYCWSYGWGTPYGPVLAIVRQICGVNETDPPEAIARQVHQVLEELEMVPEDHTPYLLHLLGVQGQRERLPVLPAEELKVRVYATLRRLVGRMGQRQPLVVAIEDLHWSDATSEALLTFLVEHMAGIPILLLVTYRPEYHPAWLDKSYATQLTLQPLTSHESRRLLQEVIPVAEVSNTLVQRLLAQADGNPFFVEELGQTVIEHGASSPSPSVPGTIQAVLMARIDRLPPAAKQLLQIAAVIGKDVSIPLLEAVAELPAEALYESLEHLQGAEFLHETRLVPTPVHTFKHVLTQEVAYQSLLPSTRQPYHRRSAQVLNERFPETVAVHPELLAHHYTEAGMEEQAIPCWQQAGQRAVERSANSEAISHFTKGLDLLQNLPVTPEHTKQELDLQLALGPPLRMIKGHATPEVEGVYIRVYQLSQQVGDNQQQFSALASLSRLYLNQARIQKACEVAEQCVDLAQRVQNPAFLLEAHRVFGQTLFWRGDLVTARRHLEQGIALYDVQQVYLRAFGRTMDPGVVYLSVLAWTLWMLGYPDRALTRIREALALAQELSHAYSLAFALNYATTLHAWRREVQFAKERAEAVITLSNEHGFIHALSLGMIKRGWAVAKQGAVEEGIRQLHQGLAAARDTGSELSLSHYLALLAEAYSQGGQVGAGLHTLAEALAHLDNTGERYFEAELHRLKGECLLAQTNKQSRERDAEECFRQALDIAHCQQAMSLELRAALSLGRLMQQQGRRAEARQILAESYRWFTEGFETPDLQEAKALLEALR